ESTCCGSDLDVSCLAELCCLLFFFSSRRRHTRLVSDWSSDVCSSDLQSLLRACRSRAASGMGDHDRAALTIAASLATALLRTARSEERRVGKECRSRWSADH